MLNKLNSDNQASEESIEKKRSNSQRKYQQAPDIITQVKPNSFIQPPILINQPLLQQIVPIN